MLTRAAWAYAGILAIKWAGSFLSLQTLAIVPVFALTGIGIVFTVRGLEIEGKGDFNRAGLLMIAGFGLGVLGAWSLLVAAIDHDITVEACEYSKIRPLDPYAQWACPQVQASYWVLWSLAFSLFIPAVLFLAVPFLSLREENKQQQMVEAEQRGANAVEK